MKFLLPLFFSTVFFLATSLFGRVAVTENEPSALVEGIVNVITGDFYALEDDIIIQAAEPIRLRRSYISNGGEGRWGSFESHTARLFPPLGILHVRESNGTILAYRSDFKGWFHKKKKKQDKNYHVTFHPLNLEKDAQGLANTARGQISARTNLKNQYVIMEDIDHFTIVCPNGTKKTYCAVANQEPKKVKLKGPLQGKIKVYNQYDYLLRSEELPNGNRIIYHWNNNTLHSIQTVNHNGQKVYAEARVQQKGEIKEKDGIPYWNNADLDIHTSDGRMIQYHYFCDGTPKHHQPWYLHQIHSSDSPTETIHYYDRENFRKPILAAINLPHHRNLHVIYNNNPNDPLCNRVIALCAPVGKDNNSTHVTHRFHYNPSARMTTVTDIEGIPTHYYWDENLHLTTIERFTRSDTLYCSTLFAWGQNNTPDASNLLCRALCNEKREALHATSYTYDGQGNVLLEKFYGNLAGQGNPLVLNQQRLPIESGVESYTKKCDYSQDGRNLLLRKEEANGLVVTYDYLPGTDLISAELSYDHRTAEAP